VELLVLAELFVRTNKMISSKSNFWIVSVIAASLFAASFFYISFSHRERIESFEFPTSSEDTLARDYWLQGTFLGYKPTNIKRIERWHGKRLDSDDISFFVKIVIPSDEIEKTVENFKSDSRYNFKRYDNMKSENAPLPSYWPSWFPVPSPENYLGTINDERSWTVSIYRLGRSNELFLRL
jgi:hypothetical protein